MSICFYGSVKSCQKNSRYFGVTGSGYEVLDWLRCIHHLLVDASIDPPLNAITSRTDSASASADE